MAKTVKKHILTEKEEGTLAILAPAQKFLKDHQNLCDDLALAAHKVHRVRTIKPGTMAIAFSTFVLGIIMAIVGVVLTFLRAGNYGPLMAFAGIVIVVAAYSRKVLPFGINNKKKMEKEWQDKLSELEKVLAEYPFNSGKFPLPARYSHPHTLARMIKIVREGRADSVDMALEALKEDLKKMDSSVTLDGKDYEEVITIKPMFMINNYQ